MVGTGGPRFLVLAEGRELVCALRGRLKKDRHAATSLAVVGDRVAVTPHADGSGSIEEVRPRTSELRRPGFKGRDHVLAANLDLLIIVQAAAQPPFNRHLVERFLTLAASGGMPVLLVVNKCELVEPATLAAQLAPLRENRVPTLHTSAVTGQGLGALRERVTGKVAAMVGPSGVGKSSLLNALDVALALKTRELSEATRKGRHTTSTSRLYPLLGGGFLADTPGIRELGLFDGDRKSLDGVFPEVAQLAHACRFRSCSHTHEPDCAVKSAVADGVVSEDRYQHYLRLRAGE